MFQQHFKQTIQLLLFAGTLYNCVSCKQLNSLMESNTEEISLYDSLYALDTIPLIAMQYTSDELTALQNSNTITSFNPIQDQKNLRKELRVKKESVFLLGKLHRETLYNSKGVRTQEISYRDSSRSYVKYESTFDKNGNKIASQVFKGKSMQALKPLSLFETDYAHNRIVKTRSYSYDSNDDNSKVLDGTTSFVYDSLTNRSKETLIDIDETIDSFKVINYYNKHDLLIRSEWLEQDNQTVSTCHEYFYNNKGWKTCEISRIGQDDMKGSRMYYVYNESGQEITNTYSALEHSGTTYYPNGLFKTSFNYMDGETSQIEYKYEYY